MPRPSRSTLAAAAAAGAVAVVAAWRRREARPETQVRTLVARNARVGALGARSSARYAAHRARRTFAAAARREALDAEFQLRTAEEVAATLGDMKGALMKLGQMASYLDQGLPEPVRDALAQLRTDAPPMAPELAAEVVTAELGATPDIVFAEWDPVPIAAASIGQVHRALTHDARAVAVKVQYPGVARAIEADLVSASLLFSGVGTTTFRGLDTGPLVAELRERLVEELDYTIEADNQALFADHYRGHPFIHVPDVVPELSSARVLTSELAAGEPFEVVAGADQATRDRAAEIIYRFVFRSLYRFQAFNGDPHPGNYLFGADGRVTFLDFGLVKRFSDAELADFSDLVQAIAVDRDPIRFRRVVERVGLLPAGHPASDEELLDYFGHFYELVDATGPSTVTSSYASESVRRILDPTGPYAEIQRSANLPPAFVVIQRINLGLYALMGELEATADWRGISEELWPFVDGPPRTALGEQEAAWLAGQARGPDRR